MRERIKIINTPPGQAPEWVRDEWVGVELPVEEDAPGQGESVQFGIFGGKPENLGGYPVRTRDAIDALREKAPKAAQWWENNVTLLNFSPRLVFRRDVCEVVPESSNNQ